MVRNSPMFCLVHPTRSPFKAYSLLLPCSVLCKHRRPQPSEEGLRGGLDCRENAALPLLLLRVVTNRVATSSNSYAQGTMPLLLRPQQLKAAESFKLHTKRRI